MKNILLWLYLISTEDLLLAQPVSLLWQRPGEDICEERDEDILPVPSHCKNKIAFYLMALDSICLCCFAATYLSNLSVLQISWQENMIAEKKP